MTWWIALPFLCTCGAKHIWNQQESWFVSQMGGWLSDDVPFNLKVSWFMSCDLILHFPSINDTSVYSIHFKSYIPFTLSIIEISLSYKLLIYFLPIHNTWILPTFPKLLVCSPSHLNISYEFCSFHFIFYKAELNILK